MVVSTVVLSAIIGAMLTVRFPKKPPTRILQFSHKNKPHPPPTNPPAISKKVPWGKIKKF